jgi:hypothetical protein
MMSLVRALLVGVVLTAGCRTEPDPWAESQKAAEAQVAQKTELQEAGIAVKAIHGREFNKFFPADGADGYARTFTAEKEDGFAEAKLTKGDVEARVAVSDTISNPAAAAKYAGATEKVKDAPVIASGMKTSALVNGRLQVTVMSQQLDAAGRKALLEQFDLAGLAALVP